MVAHSLYYLFLQLKIVQLLSAPVKTISNSQVLHKLLLQPSGKTCACGVEDAKALFPLCTDDGGWSLKHAQNKNMFKKVCEIAATFLCGTLLLLNNKLLFFFFEVLMQRSFLMHYDGQLVTYPYSSMKRSFTSYPGWHAVLLQRPSCQRCAC